MTLDIRYHPRTVEDRGKLGKEEWQEIRAKISEVRNEGIGHEDVKLVPNPLLDRAVWELTVDGERTDHRVFLDIEDSGLKVLAVFGFEFTHQGDEHWEELEERL